MVTLCVSVLGEGAGILFLMLFPLPWAGGGGERKGESYVWLHWIGRRGRAGQPGSKGKVILSESIGGLRECRVFSTGKTFSLLELRENTVTTRRLRLPTQFNQRKEVDWSLTNLGSVTFLRSPSLYPRKSHGNPDSSTQRHPAGRPPCPPTLGEAGPAATSP